MIGIEMQNAEDKRTHAMSRNVARFERRGSPSEVERAFACQLATSVWLSQLGDGDARKVLCDYAKARYRNRRAQAGLRIALEREYRVCRERLDLCN